MAVFKKVDCVMLKVDELQKGLDFYHLALGHEILWRTKNSAGLKLPNSDAELVLSTENGPEVDLEVHDTHAVFHKQAIAHGRSIGIPEEQLDFVTK